MNSVETSHKFHEFCVDCPNADLSVDITEERRIGGQIKFFVEISCKNYKLCKNLKKHLGGEG